MKVFGWGHATYRLELPLREIAARGGSETAWSEELPDCWADNADVIVKYFGLPATKRWEQLCERGAPRCVFDLDDDVWNIDPSHHPDIYYHLTDPAWIHQMERDIAASHVVTVTTDGLAEKVSRFNSNVVVVPNRVPAWWLDYHQQNPAPRGPMLTIGWQGTYGHRMDWYNAAPHIGRVLSRHANVEAHMMGSLFEPMHYWTKTFFTPWTDVVDDYWRMVDFDIGLAPLRDHPFNWCKSSLKALEYGAMGIPVVASAVGPYLDYVRHGETGFLVREDHEWGEYLDQLIEDADLRAELGANGHKQALEHTIEENLDCWVDAWQLG